ncbi:hypothetical protein DL89DRAFT_90465 [Linderina pennispora]|uniref:Uncharacterized protein n=1 Tax=Linderina pennispora TaxID=61395 RepID=A0A1Y1WID5_9FUNG|nr:uncharacterized protein DL89DRAFT_90465 [Linderina pennispora]ORX73263.1 hypothetical protein DL89DRAFT_90465 [Linderina pennispora]
MLNRLVRSAYALITQTCLHALPITMCAYMTLREKRVALRIFAHEAHHSPVVDFDWNPCDKYQYTIGSLEAGIESGQGELHVWRPSTIALFGV